MEYYIESSQDPDFEDNEFIYDDIIGLDEVELSGVGLPSSATTDSNETGGTPTSIISGSSPIASPPLSVPPYNHSSDSSNECAEKKAIFKDTPKVQFCVCSKIVNRTYNTEYISRLELSCNVKEICQIKASKKYFPTVEYFLLRQVYLFFFLV